MISLVTGGAGLVGSYLVDLLLSKGHEVRVIDNSRENASANLQLEKLRIRYLDIRDVKSNDSFFNNVDYIFHLAGLMDLVPSIERPALYVSVNCDGTVAMLEAARHSKVQRFVYAASSSRFGDHAPTPTKETDPIDCRHPYALSKYLGELACDHWHQVYGVPTNKIIIFNAYGPRLRGTPTEGSKAYGAVMGIFMKQRLSGAPYTVVGDGFQGRDFLHSRDVAEAFYQAAVTEYVGEAYNIGGGEPQSVNRIIELMGGGEVVHLPKRPGEPDVTWADISKAKAQLGWEPKISFAEGVAEMMADIKAFEHIPLWDKDSIQDATKTWFKELGK